MFKIMKQRYRPAPGGIMDTDEGKLHLRDYTPVETLDTVAWLNARERGYQLASIGAVKS